MTSIASHRAAPTTAPKRPGEAPVSAVLLDGGVAAFDELLEQIAAATQSIEIRAFLWRDDDIGNAVGQALFEAAERGVRISIKKDCIASVYEYSNGTRQSFFHKDIDRVRRFQAWFLGTVYEARPRRLRIEPNGLVESILSHPNIEVARGEKRFDHAKVFVFDDKRMIIGSMGVGDNHHTHNIEMAVLLEGAEHIERYRRRTLGLDSFDPGLQVDFLVHSRDTPGPSTLLAERIAIIDAARFSVRVEMAYLGDRRFTAALIRAVRRGVELTLITSAQADVLGNLNRATCNRILRATGSPPNVRVCLMPRMVHSKVVVADGTTVDIGSANFTPLSNGVYDETNVHIRDVALARAADHALRKHCDEGQWVEGRVGFKRAYVLVEKAIVAYQGRKRVLAQPPPAIRAKKLLAEPGANGRPGPFGGNPFSKRAQRRAQRRRPRTPT